MFKRMSVLRRRPGDEAGYFAQRWIRHGELVTRLPGVRGYVQNFVEEVLLENATHDGVKADGFVELFFDDPEAMQKAFGSEESIALKADEPHFLGHATGYCIAGDKRQNAPAHATKFIVTSTGPGSMDALSALRSQLASTSGFIGFEADAVSELIAKPGMKDGPQPVDAFAHLFFAGRPAANAIGVQSFDNPDARLALFRVRALTLLPRAGH